MVERRGSVDFGDGTSHAFGVNGLYGEFVGFRRHNTIDEKGSNILLEERGESVLHVARAERKSHNRMRWVRRLQCVGVKLKAEHAKVVIDLQDTCFSM